MKTIRYEHSSTNMSGCFHREIAFKPPRSPLCCQRNALAHLRGCSVAQLCCKVERRGGRECCEHDNMNRAADFHTRKLPRQSSPLVLLKAGCSRRSLAWLCGAGALREGGRKGWRMQWWRLSRKRLLIKTAETSLAQPHQLCKQLTAKERVEGEVVVCVEREGERRGCAESHLQMGGEKRFWKNG